MTTVDIPAQRHSSVSRRRPSIAWVVTAASVFLGSAVLQLIASFQRWSVFRDSWTRDDRSVEDHLFDYAYPADPWENLGSTAQFFGAGFLVLAVGILAMVRAAPGRRVLSWLLGAVAAISFALDGGHALASGLMDAPSPVQNVAALQSGLSLLGFLCLVALGVLWLRSYWAASVACLFLLGATAPGYLVATFAIAPIFAGYQSYDTTPYTETVVAVSTALAAIAMLVAVMSARAMGGRGSAASAR